jgi:hypothetical protein
MVSKCWRQGTVVVSLNRTINIILGIVVLIISAWWSHEYRDEANRPPVKYLSIAILTRSIHPGETMVGRTTSDRTKQCRPATVKRYLVRLNSMNSGGEESAYHDEADVTPTELGEGVSVLFRMKIPADIDPGLYIYRAFATYDCAGKIWIIPIPEASFRVCAVDDMACKD